MREPCGRTASRAGRAGSPVEHHRPRHERHRRGVTAVARITRAGAACLGRGGGGPGEPAYRSGACIGRSLFRDERLPAPHRLAPADALDLLSGSFEHKAAIVSLGETETWRFLHEAANRGLAGPSPFHGQGRAIVASSAPHAPRHCSKICSRNMLTGRCRTR